MRPLSTLYLAAVLCVTQVVTAPAASWATESVNPASAEQQLAAVDRPLLPVRPQNFNPMQPPSVPDVENVEAQQQLAESSSVLGMYMTELSNHMAQMSRFVRCLVLVMVAGVLLLSLVLLYQRRSAVALERALRVAIARTEIAEKSVSVIKETGQMQLRAYVLVNGARGGLMDDKSGRYGVQVEIRNFGVTPAYNLTGWLTVFVDEAAAMQEAPSQPHNAEITQRILPPAGVCLQHANTHQSVTHELKAVGAGARAIYIHAEIRYKDIFGNERYSRFRGVCAGAQNLNAGNFELSPGGSEAD